MYTRRFEYRFWMEILYIKEAIAMKLQFSIKRLDEISIHIFGLAK